MLYEVFEMFTDKREFWWAVFAADGTVVDSWSRDLHYDDEAERMVGSRAFPTEEAFREWVAQEYPDAVDRHRYVSPERNAELAAAQAVYDAQKEG